jgi:hypothetical protein
MAQFYARSEDEERCPEAGCSTHEIKAITGHTTLAEVERYTRGANQKALAESAMAKSEDHNANKLPQTEESGLGNSRNRPGISK